jgi:hypothetical protein
VTEDRGRRRSSAKPCRNERRHLETVDHERGFFIGDANRLQRKISMKKSLLVDRRHCLDDREEQHESRLGIAGDPGEQLLVA